MKILIVNWTDWTGGAAIAAFRLTRALCERGHEAILAVAVKTTDAPFVKQIPKSRAFFSRARRFSLRRISGFLMRHFSSENTILHSINLFSELDVEKINAFGADVVNLHWIGSNTLCARDIAKIKAPVVWTMHDSFPACGAEHHPDVLAGDVRYKSAYSKKNRPATTKGFDICRIAWRLKKKHLKDFPIIFTAPSAWQAQVLRDSALFGTRQCFVCPNLLEKEIFFPLKNEERAIAKTLFGLSEKKFTLCFGAAEDAFRRNSRKGGSYLKNAILLLSEEIRKNLQILVFGPSNEKFKNEVALPVFFTGNITNPKILRSLYALSDVFVCPSVIENLPYTCLEATFCATPVAAFNVGGILDIVEHKKTGYLSEPYSEEDLARGIEYCLKNRAALSAQCIKKATRDFDSEKIVEKYIAVYNRAKMTGGGYNRRKFVKVSRLCRTKCAPLQNGAPLSKKLALHSSLAKGAA